MEFLLLVAGAIGLALFGLRIGILLAPRVGRWAERAEPPEDGPGDGLA